MRSHVDVDATTGLSNLQAVMAAREQWRGIVDIELVAFPQAGVVTCPGTAEILDAAVREGADVVGGSTRRRSTAMRTASSTSCSASPKRGAKIDIHLHGPVKRASRSCCGSRRARARAGGRVNVSHAYALGQ